MRKKRLIQKIVIGSAIICLVVSTLSFVAGYHTGFASGHSEGHTAGYENGYSYGITIGRSHGFNRWNPTYAEMLDFIRRDKTDENTYVEDVYTCFEFTADVSRNADAENIRSAFVYILFRGEAHSIVAFDTIDRGLIFIEPQTDEQMYLEVGRPYWPRDRYSPPPYDDTIVRITIIW